MTDTDDVSWLQALLERRRPDPGPIVGRGSVEFDGDDAKWSDVTEIRTRSLIEYLFTGGIDKQADKLPLPWCPGRGMLINAISRAALTLLLAAAKQELEGTPLKIRMPAEVHYRGTLRTRERKRAEIA